MAEKMSDKERRALWRQYAQAHAKAQDTFDSSVRTLAAAGVAVTVTLATALQTLPMSGTIAVTVFLACLACNLVSFVTAQLDLRLRLSSVRRGEWKGAERNLWTTCTLVLNILAGSSLLVAGGLLAYFVASSV